MNVKAGDLAVVIGDTNAGAIVRVISQADAMFFQLFGDHAIWWNCELLSRMDLYTGGETFSRTAQAGEVHPIPQNRLRPLPPDDESVVRELFAPKPEEVTA